jgi:outer membrane protein assembly factor BamB/tetratricopeptide (TPR) repeat protein
MSTPKRVLTLATLFISASIAQEAGEMKDLQAVYVRDSGIASEKIALAERMERLKEWDKSADVYQEIVDKYADRVIPTRSDETGQISQYTSVALVVQEKLAKWPEEGLNVYRGRYEQSALDMLDRAGDDRLALQRIFSQYFPTDSAKTAGLRLLSMSLERGEFASAAWVGRRLISHHPSLVVERPAVLFQTAIAEHLAGNKIAAQSRLDELKQKYPQATGQVRGEDAVLADILAAELASQPSLYKTFQSDAWPMPFGNPEASALPQHTSNGGARMFSVDIPKVEPRRSSSSNRQQQAQLAEQRKLGGMTGIMPAVDSGEIFFQDNARIYAISLTSGLPLPGWLQSYPGNKRGAFSIAATPTPPGMPLGLSVTDQHVVSVLGQGSITNMNFHMRNQGGPESQLVCLDRTTGRPVWSTTTQKLKLPEEYASLAQGQFCGMPLVIEDVVYVPVRANRGGQFEEVHLVAIRLRDGGYLWSSYIASTAGSNQMIDMETGMPLGSFNPMISYADGRLYVLTNLGAIACLDASDGKTVWLNIYPRSGSLVTRGGVRVNRFFNSRQPARKPFTQDPPMIVDGRLFVAPSDADTIFIYDAASGEMVTRINRSLESPKYEAADMMLAVAGDQLVLGNRSTIFSIPWKTFDPKKSILANGGKYRTFEHNGGGSKGEEAIRGRPFVSADRIYIPIASKLHRMSLSKWLIEDSYPQNGVWDSAEEAPGNVLATPDHVIIASDTRVVVYADLAVATAKLDRIIEQDPTVAEPYLRYGELLLAGGRSRDAIDWLDNAIGRIGKTEDGTLTPGEPRGRLFEIACGFATKLHRTEAATPEIVRQLFERARLAADSPEQQVRYRLAHAAFLRSAGDAESEVALHQEILATPEWRAASVAGRSGASTAATEAETAIAELLGKNAKLYEPYDRAAKQAFDALAADTPAAAYLDIAEQYPLSATAVPALQRAADRFSADDEHRLATQTLRRLLKRSADPSTKAETLTSLARGYMRMPGQVDLAIIRLDQARKIDPRARLTAPIPLDGDQKIEPMPLADAVGVLKAYRARVEAAALPRLGLPDGNAEPDKPALLAPEEFAGVRSIVKQQPRAARADRVVVYRNDGTVVELSAGAIRPLGPGAKVGGQPIGCAYGGDTLIVVTPTGVLATQSGKELWSMSLSSLPGADSVAGPAAADDDADEDVADANVQLQQRLQINGRVRIINGAIFRGGFVGQPQDTSGPERISHFRVLSDRVVFATSTGRVVSCDLGDGKVNWQGRPVDGAVRHFDAIDDFVVVSTTDASAYSEVHVLDAITGQGSRLLNFDPQTRGQQLINLTLSREGVLVTTTQNELAGRDLYDAGNAPWKREVGNRQQGEMPFMNVTREDQLITTNGRILALTATGLRPQSVHAFDLHTGEPRQSTDPRNGRKIDTAYPVGSVGNINTVPLPIGITPISSQFYITGPKSFKAFNLDSNGSWAPDGLAQRGTIADLLVASDYAVLIHSPVAAQPAQQIDSIQIAAYSRDKLPTGDESGLLVHRPTIKDPAKIVAGEWQVANGAIYYITGDQKLKMLKANP